MEGLHTGIANVTNVEDGLAVMLTATSREVAHSEYFDAEQRAEVYTILETLRANTATHREMARKLAGKSVEH